MTQEALLSYLHLLAILTAVVFLTSEAALCRPGWLNANVVRRLVAVDRIYLVALAAIFVTGLLRIHLGAKGAGWYWSNWLLHAKLVLFLVMVGLAVPVARGWRRWRARLEADGALPGEAEMTRMRKLVMVQAHMLPVILLFAVFLARGAGG